MSNTTLIKVLIHLLVKFVVRQAKQLDLLLVNAKNKPRGNTEEGMAMLLEWIIGNCVRDSILKSLKNGIYPILKLIVKMVTTS